MGDDFQPFRHIAVAGLGLIGGSIALGIREQWPSTRVTGIDRGPVLAHALGSGAIDRGGTLDDIGDADLIVLAAPVRANTGLLRDIAARRHRVLVTDVGGTKREIVSAAHEIDGLVTFVGGHPLGGAERGGFGFARPDLFAGRPWIFTPDPRTPAAAIERLYGFARGLGARPTALSADEHDRLMAFVSHLPQLAASALMASVGEAVGASGLQLAGRGLVDSTRLASSPASVWRDVCATNAHAIADAIDRMIRCLQDLRSDLTEGGSIETVFGDAARWRGELMKGRDV